MQQTQSQNNNKKPTQWTGFPEYNKIRVIQLLEDAFTNPKHYDLKQQQNGSKYFNINNKTRPLPQPSYLKYFYYQGKKICQNQKALNLVPILFLKGYLHKKEMKYRDENPHKKDEEIFEYMKKKYPASQIYYMCIKKALDKGLGIQGTRQMINRDMDFCVYAIKKIIEKKERGEIQDHKYRIDCNRSGDQKRDWQDRVFKIMRNMLDKSKDPQDKDFFAPPQKKSKNQKINQRGRKSQNQNNPSSKEEWEQMLASNQITQEFHNDKKFENQNQDSLNYHKKKCPKMKIIKKPISQTISSSKQSKSTSKRNKKEKQTIDYNFFDERIQCLPQIPFIQQNNFYGQIINQNNQNNSVPKSYNYFQQYNQCLLKQIDQGQSNSLQQDLRRIDYFNQARGQMQIYDVDDHFIQLS